MDWSLSGAVVLSGIVIVFLILVCLICMVWVTGAIIGRGNGKEKPAVSKGGPVSPVVEQGISGETVAVIAAAVAATMEAQSPGAAYTVTSIQRARTARPVWGFAGMQQNTRPF